MEYTLQHHIDVIRERRVNVIDINNSMNHKNFETYVIYYVDDNVLSVSVNVNYKTGVYSIILAELGTIDEYVETYEYISLWETIDSMVESFEVVFETNSYIQMLEDLRTIDRYFNNTCKEC